MKSLATALVLAASLFCGVAYATNLSMVGTPSLSVDSSISAGATVKNNDTASSNTIRLEVWAMASPYAGGALGGYKLADDGGLLGSIAPGHVATSSIFVGTFTAPPAGTWNLVVVWTEFDGASTNNGYSPRAYANMGTKAFGTAPPPPPGALENPAAGSFQSGIGLISGWSCQGPVTVNIDGVSVSVPYGSPRGDTAAQCSGASNNGFGLLLNYNLLGPGQHTAQLYVNGSARGSPVQFTVTVPNGEFMQGVSKTITVPDFPTPGRTATLIWQESQQNFAIQSVTP